MALDTILIIAVTILVIVSAAIVFGRRKSKSGDSAMVSYIAGLRSIISGDHQNAFVKLRQAVDLDTENIDAYLKLGDMFRAKGLTDKAIQIHRELTLRKGVSDDLKFEIKKSMALDYIAADAYEHAIDIIKPMLKESDHKIWAEDNLLELYIAANRWAEADEIYKPILKKRNLKDFRTAAGIKNMIGLDLFDKGEYHKARIAFKDAISFDETYPLPFINIAQSYLKEERTEDALQFLKKLCDKVPQYAYLSYSFIEETLFNLGRFGDVEDIYRGVLNAVPDNIPTSIALSGILEKKGEIPTAENLLRTVLNADNINTAAAIRLTKLLSSSDRSDEGFEILSDIAERIDIGIDHHECDLCGYRIAKPEPICPDCNGLGTFFK